MTDTKAIQKRKRPDLQPIVDEGDNARFLSHMVSLKAQPSIDLNDPEAVQKRIEWYFQKCIDDDMKPGVEALALALHVNRKTLYSWANDMTRKNSTQSNAVKDAYQLISAMMEAYMQNGKINPVAGIFLMANNMGYQQKVTHEVEQPKTSILEGKSPEELRARYADVIDLTNTEPIKPAYYEDEDF